MNPELETVTGITRAIGLVILYGITGFGPGLFLGLFLGNITGGRGRDHLTHKHDQAVKTAIEHNAQWHPSHKRWES